MYYDLHQVKVGSKTAPHLQFTHLSTDGTVLSVMRAEADPCEDEAALMMDLTLGGWAAFEWERNGIGWSCANPPDLHINSFMFIIQAFSAFIHCYYLHSCDGCRRKQQFNATNANPPPQCSDFCTFTGSFNIKGLDLSQNLVRNLVSLTPIESSKCSFNFLFWYPCLWEADKGEFQA